MRLISYLVLLVALTQSSACDAPARRREAPGTASRRDATPGATRDAATRPPARPPAALPDASAPAPAPQVNSLALPAWTAVYPTTGPRTMPSLTWKDGNVTYYPNLSVAAGDVILWGTMLYGELIGTSIADGRQRWIRPNAKRGGPGTALCEHGILSPSRPVLADGRLFALSCSGDVTAILPDTGQVLWTHTPRFTDRSPGYVNGVSPIVAGESVLVVLREDKDEWKVQGRVMAMDRQTGKVRWEQRTPGEPRHLAAVNGAALVLGGKALHALDLATGRRLWANAEVHDKNDGRNWVPWRVVGDTLVLCQGTTPRVVSLGSGQTLPTGRAHCGNEVNGLVITWDAGRSRFAVSEPTSGALRWERRSLYTHKDEFYSVADGVLYLAESGALSGVDLATGKVLWRFRLRTPLNSRPVPANGSLCFSTSTEGFQCWR